MYCWRCFYRSCHTWWSYHIVGHWYRYWYVCCSCSCHNWWSYHTTGRWLATAHGRDIMVHPAKSWWCDKRHSWFAILWRCLIRIWTTSGCAWCTNWWWCAAWTRWCRHAWPISYKSWTASIVLWTGSPGSTSIRSLIRISVFQIQTISIDNSQIRISEGWWGGCHEERYSTMSQSYYDSLSSTWAPKDIMWMIKLLQHCTTWCWWHTCVTQHLEPDILLENKTNELQELMRPMVNLWHWLSCKLYRRTSLLCIYLYIYILVLSCQIPSPWVTNAVLTHIKCTCTEK